MKNTLKPSSRWIESKEWFEFLEKKTFKMIKRLNFLFLQFFTPFHSQKRSCLLLECFQKNRFYPPCRSRHHHFRRAFLSTEMCWHLLCDNFLAGSIYFSVLTFIWKNIFSFKTLKISSRIKAKFFVYLFMKFFRFFFSGLISFKIICDRWHSNMDSSRLIRFKKTPPGVLFRSPS